MVLTSKLVGAEDLRLALEAMLKARDFLSGRAAVALTSKPATDRNPAADPTALDLAPAAADTDEI